MPEGKTKRVRLAVAQPVVHEDPRDPALLRESGRELRRLMREAHHAGARIVHFPEGATCSPHKRIMSATGPDQVGPSDWDRFEWDVLREELAETVRTARELKLWTVLGSVHRLTAPNRPHNSLYVISDQGEVVTRYDERLLSHTKMSYMYAPGTAPCTFEVDGVRFGCSLGIEVHFPEVFREYEQLDVDCVLFSTTGAPEPEGLRAFATEAQGHAASNSIWVSFAVPAQNADTPSGVVSPTGKWLARCSTDGSPSMAVVDIDDSSQDVEIAVFKARPWRRRVRAGVYDPHFVQDPRSEDRSAF
jgi:predicted amidohydrolase